VGKGGVVCVCVSVWRRGGIVVNRGLGMGEKLRGRLTCADGALSPRCSTGTSAWGNGQGRGG
jgi:hypothetical protein